MSQRAEPSIACLADTETAAAKEAMPRWSRRILVIVLMIAAGLVAGGFWLASSASPAVGRKVVAGLGGPVEVIRDDRSVPHIFARSEADAAAALGWVHAEDRMAQMEMTRRLGAGRLAEVVGPAALPSDRWMRTVGLYRRAQLQYPLLSERVRGLHELHHPREIVEVRELVDVHGVFDRLMG